ncbi:gag protease polyprotein [Cucumis melo var. makuwa]|uniref:Gag protease polyprotein n=1 Tax=Cucumis melo var. makuwa TaxID=1194695 RepID=A0A5D3C9M9_CUCMM|nr:gag protease polyprotein [Cucumis melo var. makuwa]
MLSGDVNQITWEQFKENLYAKFFSASLRYAKQKEFLNLEQCDMTVEQYDADFDMMSPFAPDVVTNEVAKTDKFVSVDMSLHERVDPSEAAVKGCVRSHRGRCLVGSGGRLFATTCQEAEQAGIMVIGMDWLSANHASINCSRKEVVFNSSLKASFKYNGEGTVVLPKVISTMKVSNLLNQSTWSILASVVDTREPEVSLSSEPVVREYPDIFSNELSGLPPPREMDFAIELE